jgi:uncharacterized protein (TIGR03435 family)
MMKRASFSAIFFSAVLCSAMGQTAKPRPSFEVASVKPVSTLAIAAGEPARARRVGCNGGPGTNDAGLYTCENMSLLNLILLAYDLQQYQIPNAAAYRGDLFQISARVPEGATKDDLKLMLQGLLEERFKLVYRREKKEGQVFELVVGKNGHKLKESEPAPPAQPEGANAPEAGAARRFEVDRNGVPMLPANRNVGAVMTMNSNGSISSRTRDTTMAQLARQLAMEVGRPVTDATGLTGKYEIALSYVSEAMRAQLLSGPRPAGAQPDAAPEAEPGPTIFTAVQEQLGLKLEPKTGLIETFVIEKVERTPTEN